CPVTPIRTVKRGFGGCGISWPNPAAPFDCPCAHNLRPVTSVESYWADSAVTSPCVKAESCSRDHLVGDRGQPMLDAANYSAVETLRDGRELQIRALRPEDREDFLSAVSRAGARSRYLRFFSSKRDFSEREKAFFLNVDFDKHVALVALMNEAGQKV